MRILCDINTSFQNSIVGLATIIYENLNEKKTIDDIILICKNVYAEYNLQVHIYNEDVFDALLLLYSKNLIDYYDGGKVGKIK